MMRQLLKRYPIDISPYFYEHNQYQHQISDKQYTTFNHLFSLSTDRSVALVKQFDDFNCHSHQLTIDPHLLPSSNFLGVD
jgi:hypothetical protein